MKTHTQPFSNLKNKFFAVRSFDEPGNYAKFEFQNNYPQVWGNISDFPTRKNNFHGVTNFPRLPQNKRFGLQTHWSGQQHPNAS